MAVAIAPYLRKHEAEVREFNNRVRGSEGAFEFPECAVPEWLPPAPGHRVYQDQFLALNGAEVRGGYLLKHQDFSFRGETASIGYYHSALSEGLVDKKFSTVGVQLLMDALKRQPLLYALGMGAMNRPLPRMLKAAGWKLSEVPFFFRIVHPSPFLRNIETLRTSNWRRFAMTFAALTGVGYAGVHLYQRMKSKPQSAPHATVDFFDTFGPWADALWTQCAPQYPFIAVRDSETLGILYPGGKFLRMKIASGGQTIGWAVALDTQMQWNKHFGDMRIGSIVDCLALPEHALHVIAAARRVLERRGVDLILCNHSHPAWIAALRGAGFLDGPSNFIFGASKALTKKMDETGGGDVFLMRGDGDGPIHL